MSFLLRDLNELVEIIESFAAQRATKFTSRLENRSSALLPFSASYRDRYLLALVLSLRVNIFPSRISLLSLSLSSLLVSTPHFTLLPRPLENNGASIREQIFQRCDPQVQSSIPETRRIGNQFQRLLTETSGRGEQGTVSSVELLTLLQ